MQRLINCVESYDIETYTKFNENNQLYTNLFSKDEEERNTASKKIAEHIDNIWSTRNKCFYIKFMNSVSKLNDEEIDILLYRCADPLQRCILNLQKNLILSKFGMTVHRLVKSRYREQDIDNPTPYDSGEVMYHDDVVVDNNGELADIYHHYVEISSLLELQKFIGERRKYWYGKDFLGNPDNSRYFLVEYFPLNIKYFKDKKDQLLKENTLIKLALYDSYADSDKHKKTWLERVLSS